jgi:hypothetical protein
VTAKSGRVRSGLAELGLADPEPAEPGGPSGANGPGGEPGRPGDPQDSGRRDSGFSAWSPAPTLGSHSWFEPAVADTSAGHGPGDLTAPADPDAAADWDRLAAGVQAARSRFGAVAERWTAQTDVDVANEWPGPPLRAARQAAILNGWKAEPPAPPAEAGPAQAGTTQAGTTQAGTAQAAGPEPEPRPAAPAAAEPPSGQAADPADQAGQDSSAAGHRPARPPLDLPGPPDPADEWISLLTADPAEE